jgi:hypothetical protein
MSSSKSDTMTLPALREQVCRYAIERGNWTELLALVPEEQLREFLHSRTDPADVHRCLMEELADYETYRDRDSALSGAEFSQQGTGVLATLQTGERFVISATKLAPAAGPTTRS